MKLLDAAVDSRLGQTLTLGGAEPRLGLRIADSFEQSRLVAGLLREVLLGFADRDDHHHEMSGWARIGVDRGDVLLRRHGERQASRLTASPGDEWSDAAHAPGPADWQGVLAPEVIATVFCPASHPETSLDACLAPSVAEAFRQLTSARAEAAPPNDLSHERRELLRRRDEVASRIEETLASRRAESTALGADADSLDQRRRELSERVSELRSALEAVTAEVERLDSERRYGELTDAATLAEGRQIAESWAPRLSELDNEIAQWRTTLLALEDRERTVRAELAQAHPSDASPELALADQRAAVAVAGRLMEDLEAEVARLAGTRLAGTKPDGPCACVDAHGRLNPLVDTLARHVKRLAETVEEQSGAMRTQELLSEASQLERSQTELRRQLDYLLQRRQTLSRTGRVPDDRPRGRLLHGDRGAAIAEQSRLASELREAEAELAELNTRLQDAEHRRRRLLDASRLGEWQRELESLQSRLALLESSGGATTVTGTLRASELLARLTDGERVEMRLTTGGRRVELRDRTGALLQQQALRQEDRILAGWALRLALADAAHAAGAEFPLILDQPFDGLSDRHAANLATCLDDYARRGRQVVVLTTENAGVRRLEGLGLAPRVLTEAALQGEVEPPLRPVPPPTEKTVERRFKRSLWLTVDDPIDRFPVPLPDRDAAFGRARVRVVGDLIAGDPSAIAEELNLEGVTPELVALWQAHLALVCFTPGLELGDAKLLVEADVLTVEQLAESKPAALRRALERRGAGRKKLARVDDWVAAATDGVDRWRTTGFADSWARNRQERRDRIRENAHRRRRDATNGSPVRRKKKSETEELKFYLELDSPIEAAPAIGPKRATALEAIGVVLVSDLLAGDPETIADGLGDSRVDAARVVAWQHQANLVCRVAGLRGHDAQVLVGSGFTTPEEIAAMKPAELLEFVDPFCDSPEGQRALRGSARPDLAEVTKWIRGARQRREVGAGAS